MTLEWKVTEKQFKSISHAQLISKTRLNDAQNAIMQSDKRKFYQQWISYCICGYFRGGFIFANFASQSSRKFPLQYMAIYSNENIPQTAKLSHHEFPHLVQNRENICTRQYTMRENWWKIDW